MSQFAEINRLLRESEAENDRLRSALKEIAEMDRDDLLTLAQDIAREEIGWEPSEAQQGLIPIPDGYKEQ